MLSFYEQITIKHDVKTPNRSFTAFSARRPWAANMVHILPCQVHDNCGLSENLTGLITVFADIDWVINHQHNKEYIHAFSFIIWCVFDENSPRQSVEAIPGVAVFDQFYRDSAYDYKLQSRRPEYLVNRSHIFVMCYYCRVIAVCFQTKNTNMNSILDNHDNVAWSRRANRREIKHLRLFKYQHIVSCTL